MGNFVTPDELYFLQFTPVYMQRIWGGDLLQKKLQRELPELRENAEPIGESWEITDRNDEDRAAHLLP